MKKNRIALITLQIEWENHLVEKANEITQQLAIENPELERFFYKSSHCSFNLSKVHFTNIDAVYRWQNSLKYVRFSKVFEIHPNIKNSFVRYLAIRRDHEKERNSS